MKRALQIAAPLAAGALGFSLGAMLDSPRGAAANAVRSALASSSAAESAAPAGREEAIGAALAALLDATDFRALAEVAARLEALDSDGMRELLEKLERLPVPRRNPLVLRVIPFWTKRDPAAATAWMQPHLARLARSQWFGGMADFGSDLVKAWTVNAPERAVEYARSQPDTALARIILGNALYAWPEKDKSRRFELLRDFPPGQARRKTIVEFCNSWAQTDRAAAFAAAASLPPGPERDGALGETLARWAGREPDAAFQQAKAMGLDNPGLLAVMAKKAAKSHPESAGRWLESQTAELRGQLGGVIMKFWAKRDPVAAFAWAHAQGIPLGGGASNAAPKLGDDLSQVHGYELAFGSPLTAAVREKPAETVAWLETLPHGAERERYAELAMGAAQDVETLQRLFRELPAEAAAAGAARIAGMLARNPAEAQTWAETLPAGAAREAAWAAIGTSRGEPLPLPAGPDRDAMLSGMALSRVYGAPVTAFERALEISDLAMRGRIFEDVMWETFRPAPLPRKGGWASGPPEHARQAAREWLARADVPADWKALPLQ